MIYLFTAYKIRIVSSEDLCTADIFYDYMYCISTESICSQCLPCYNNDTSYYIPHGTQYANQCQQDEICTKCINNCKDIYNFNIYNDNNNDNIDSSSCPLLSHFITTMNETIIHNVDSNPIHQINCKENEEILRIKYAFIVPNDYNSSNKEDCTMDFSQELVKQCDDKDSCQYDLTSMVNINASKCSSSSYQATIGSFCV